MIPSILANSIRAIKTGDYSVGDILNPSKYLIAPEMCLNIHKSKT